MWGRALWGTNLFCGLSVIVQGYGDQDLAAPPPLLPLLRGLSVPVMQARSLALPCYSLSIYLSLSLSLSVYLLQKRNSGHENIANVTMELDIFLQFCFTVLFCFYLGPVFVSVIIFFSKVIHFR